MTVSLTARAKRQLTALARTTGRSRSDIVEHLLRRHGGSLAAAGLAVYKPKIRPAQSVLLTTVGRSILEAAQARLGRPRGDIVEALLVAHGAAMRKSDLVLDLAEPALASAP